MRASPCVELQVVGIFCLDKRKDAGTPPLGFYLSLALPSLQPASGVDLAPLAFVMLNPEKWGHGSNQVAGSGCVHKGAGKGPVGAPCALAGDHERLLLSHEAPVSVLGHRGSAILDWRLGASLVHVPAHTVTLSF